MTSCPAARYLIAELARDKAQRRYDRTHSARAKVDLLRATTAALKAWNAAKGRR